MENDIDFEGIIAQLQRDNEALYHQIVRERINQLSWKVPSITMSDVRATLKTKTFWIGVGVGFLFAFAYGMVPVIAVRRAKDA